VAQAKLFSGDVITREDLNSLVDKAADIIRTATDYKFILVLLFLKRVSDTWKEEFEHKKQELMKYLSEEKAEREAENEVYHSFNLKREFLWDGITKDIKKLPENLSNALIKIADLNKDLKGVIDKFSFLGFTTQEHREKLRQLVELFNQYAFSKKYVKNDIVGDAYEHILYRFAPTQAKQGEVYTPREVIQLLVEILNPNAGQSVFDPACGSGGMLIQSYKYVREKYGKEEKLLLYGQEYNSDIYGLCRLNLVAHGITDAFIEYGDSLLYPRFTEGGKLNQFHIVVANPPWNQDSYGEETLKRADFRERFADYPPNSSADWAWIQHMLSSSQDKVGVVLDTGALSRTQGSEGAIRSQIVERDLVECVILLPKKLFYNTGSAGTIIIFRKDKLEERKGKVLFINASEQFEKNPEVRRLNTLASENIKKIANAYRDFKDIENFSKVIDLARIKKEKGKLNVSKYVLLSTKEEPINLEEIRKKLQQLEKEKEAIENEMQGYLNVILRQIATKGIAPSTFAQAQEEEIPEDWEVRTIEEICDILDSQRVPLNEETRAKIKGNIPYYGANGVVDYINDYIFDDKLILIAEDGGYFEEYATRPIAYMITGKCWVNNHAHVLKVKEEKGYVTEFIFYALEHRNIIPFIEGSTRDKLNQEELREISIALPKSKEEQERIALILSILDKRVRSEDQIGIHFQKLKNGIMQLLLSGKIRIR